MKLFVITNIEENKTIGRTVWFWFNINRAGKSLYNVNQRDFSPPWNTRDLEHLGSLPGVMTTLEPPTGGMASSGTHLSWN